MTARQARATRPREHLGILFAVVLLLCLWLVRHTGHERVSSLSVETENGLRGNTTLEMTGPDTAGSTRPDHSHAAFKQRVSERWEMVAGQIEARQVKDPNVLKAMRTVPRHAFIPLAQQRYAYQDSPLPIGQGQTISQPYIVAFMTEALVLDPNSRVLEIGTGSGYQAAVCAEIAQEVYTIEIVDALAQTASEKLKELGYRNVYVKAGDGYHGWPEKGPFDAIIGTAAAERIPPPLLEQLGKGGRMILPCRDAGGLQYLILVTKDADGRLQSKRVLPVVFVPMTGQVQKPVED